MSFLLFRKIVAPVLGLVVLAAGLALATSNAGAQEGGAEVRITAQRLEDGQLEFALQQQTDGSWGERRLPQRRFFPADAEAGNWLVTTPLTISTPAPVETPEATPEPEADDESDSQAVAVTCLAAQGDGEPFVSGLTESPLEHRSMDGEGNNLENPTWGMAGTALLKRAPANSIGGCD